MRCVSLIICLLLFVHGVVSPQSCLPEGIIFTSQEQIDNFQINNPGCTEIEGNVEIAGIWPNPGVYNLEGLNMLNSIGGKLILQNNDYLSFSGYVTDANTGFPIHNAIISVGNGASPEYFDTTNIQGYYELNTLPAATNYTILTTVPGFISQNVVLKFPPDNIDFMLTRPYSGTFVSTRYQGNILYHCNGSYFERYDGVAEQKTSRFPDIDAQGDTITMLLDSIGAGVDTTTNDTLMWNKTCILWDWLMVNACFNPADPSWQAASSFMMSQGWPSIEQISRTYLIYGFIPWGTCMSRAQIFITLLYRTGLSKHKITIAETRWKFGYSQHMYSIIFINKRWISIDPSSNTPTGQSLPAYSNLKSTPLPGPTVNRDYSHPY